MAKRKKEPLISSDGRVIEVNKFRFSISSHVYASSEQRTMTLTFQSFITGFGVQVFSSNPTAPYFRSFKISDDETRESLLSKLDAEYELTEEVRDLVREYASEGTRKESKSVRDAVDNLVKSNQSSVFN